MILTGNSLGKRQQELNLKVRDVVAEKIPFKEIKEKPEVCDIDRLFKIDIASNYQNIDYLIEVLKSGDELLISRVIKLTWLYDDDYSNIMHPDYLHHHIFPSMSTRMKKKFLSNVSINVRNEKRSVDFYNYCQKCGLSHFALKFLIFCPVELKIDLFKNNFANLLSLTDNVTDLAILIGDNFTLLESYLENISCHQRPQVLRQLRYLYSVDPDKYLDTCENYLNNTENVYMKTPIFGLRISKDITTKHKSRIAKSIHLYIKLINKKMFCKHITTDEAKIYATALLPDSAEKFWSINYKKTYSYLLDLIPSEDKYEFIKKIFKEKYPNDEFEMTSNFYQESYYELMTSEERGEWALRHLANPYKSFLSNRTNQDYEYIWYKFVNYDKAIEGIQKYLLITPEPSRRSEIIQVLITSAQNQEQLEKLFKYYYQRHVNEKRSTKESFIGKVTDVHKVWQFNPNCWAAFNQLLYSIELYNTKDFNFNKWGSQLILLNALMYHVINKIECPEGLITFADSEIQWYHLKNVLDRMEEPNEKERVYQYLLQLYADRLKNRFDNIPYDDKIQYEARRHIDNIKTLMCYFKKPDEEIPAIAVKFIELDPNFCSNHSKKIKKITQGDVIRYLKKDITLVRNKISEIEAAVASDHSFRLNIFLKKLRVYFSESLAKDFLKHFEESLTNDKMPYRNLFNAVYSIFQLADDSTKINFMKKHAPTDPKIDHAKIDRHNLYIQKAICRFAGYSRPPVPLENILAYIKGDYLSYCLPIFNMYLAELPPQQCIKFVESILDTPVSTQKHGLRLAFKCLDIENLKSLMSRVWKKQKNISLRMVIYTYLLNKITQENGKQQEELFKVLLTLTEDLHHEDHEDVIKLLTSFNKIPEKFRAAYFNIVWKTVNKFPQDNINLERRTKVIRNIRTNINSIDKNDKIFIRHIIDDYLKALFIDKHIIPSGDKTTSIIDLYKAKLQLMTSLIIIYDDMNSKASSIDLVKSVLRYCFNMWTMQSVRSYCYEFIYDLESRHFEFHEKEHHIRNDIFESILNSLEDNARLSDIYPLVWKLRLLIATNIALATKDTIRQNSTDKKQYLKSVSNYYANELIKLVKYFVSKEIFFLSFLTTISEIIVDSVTNFLHCLDLNICENYDMDLIRIFVTTELVNSGIKESALLAVTLLPMSPSDKTFQDLQNAVSNLRSFENIEIQALLHQKIQSSNHSL